MNAPVPSPPPAASTNRVFLAAALLIIAALVAWRGSYDGPFVLDDAENIAGNPSIRHLKAWREVLSPPANTGFGGRPVLNLSFAVNYALGRLSVRDYHGTNVAIHIFAGLFLLGLVRRTLLTTAPSPGFPNGLRTKFGGDALLLATAVALLWTLHPVQTAAVTYLSQRAESLMGLFYLFTLYGVTRGADSPRPGLWQTLAVVACALGMATKEVMATAPLAVLLYDRTFLAGTFRAALRARRWLYLGLAGTWAWLAVLLADARARGIGPLNDITGSIYAFTECRAVVHYLQLAFWPSPLVFDYGTDFLRTFSDAAPYALVLVPLVAATVVAVVRRPVAGFVGAWFFGILAPTSSVVPVVFMPVAENRLYLSLAAVAVLAVFTLYWLGRRRGVYVAFALAAGGAGLTAQRNRDYRTEIGLWTDTIEKSPGNAHARYNLGVALSGAGRLAAAAAQWRAALRDEPQHPPAHENLANALVSLGRPADALPHYEAALRQQPQFPLARANYGLVLLYLGRVPEAEAQLKLAVKEGPDNPGAHTNYGLALERLGRADEAVAQYEAALRLDQGFADAHHNLGVVLARAGRFPEALAHFDSALRARPGNLEAQLTLARVHLQAKQLPEAQAAAEAALAAFPHSAEAHLALGNVLATAGRFPAAAAEYERALQLQPDFPAARDNLALVRARIAQ